MPSNAINIEIKSHSDSDTPTGGSPTHDVIHPMDDEEDEENQMLPEIKEGEELDLDKLEPKQHFTQPPPRYTEASLVKKME